jgi:hypothetical protein
MPTCSERRVDSRSDVCDDSPDTGRGSPVGVSYLVDGSHRERMRIQGKVGEGVAGGPTRGEWRRVQTALEARVGLRAEPEEGAARCAELAIARPERDRGVRRRRVDPPGPPRWGLIEFPEGVARPGLEGAPAVSQPTEFGGRPAREPAALVQAATKRRISGPQPEPDLGAGDSRAFDRAFGDSRLGRDLLQPPPAVGLRIGVARRVHGTDLEEMAAAADRLAPGGRARRPVPVRVSVEPALEPSARPYRRVRRREREGVLTGRMRDHLVEP